MALIIEYLNDKYPNISRLEKVELANRLIMQSASPIKDVDGNYYSVRGQGSGVANCLNAIKANALLMVTGQNRPKAELGSSEKGEFSY